MSDTQDLRLSRQILGKAVPKMTELGIPTTLQNLTVWYEYCAGLNRELVAVIAGLLQRGEAFDKALNRKLYHRFFRDQFEQQLAKIREAIHAIVHDMGSQLLEISQDVDHYDQVLADVEQDLGQECEIESLRRIVSTLIAETRKIKDGNRNMAETISLMSEKISGLHDNLEQISNEALTDSLTGVLNRRGFEERLQQFIDERDKYHNGFTLVMLDIDHFKRFNDKYGHLVGDKVLRHVGSIIMKNIKGRDIAARIGGEEFALLLGNTNYRGGITVAESIRQALAEQSLTTGEAKEPVGRVTVSAGVASAKAQDSKVVLMDRADACLYVAKRQGRNRVLGEQDLQH